MRAGFIAMVFIALSIDALAASKAQVCLSLNRGQDCQEYSYNCDFNAKEMTQNMNAEFRLWNVNQRLGFTDVLHPTQFPKYFVQQGTFGRIKGREPYLYTTGMWPCGSVTLINPTCQYASMSHYDMTDPNHLVSVMARDLVQQKGCEPKKTHVHILESNILIDNFSRAPDNLYFRRIVCSARQLFPESKIHVYYSTKSQADSDSLKIQKTTQGYELTLSHESGQIKQRLNYTSSSAQILPHR